MNEGRIWTPIPSTCTREACTVSDSVRVVREHIPFAGRGHTYLYEVQVRCSDEWGIVAETMNADEAVRLATRYSTIRSEKAVTR